ncbi:MAG TPA: hypothetical protein ENJ09_11110 [Planctomycetes bacterium]|nr:hypothetical protein [Planctomycetota bacterium]
MDPRIPALRELVGGLESLLSLFGREQGTDEDSLASTFASCEEAFAALVEAERENSIPDPEVTELREHAKRLHAVVLGMATSELGVVRAEIERLGDIRRRLKGYAARPEDGQEVAGTSCDMAG